MSERFKIYTKQEALDILVEHTGVMMAGRGFTFGKNKEHGEAVGAAIIQVCLMPRGATITVDMEAER